MLGAIIGDVLGSTFEFYPMKTKKFELLEKNSHFTDDTVMTVAVADSIMNGVPDCIFKICGLQEGYDGLRNRTLTSTIKSIVWPNLLEFLT